MDGEQRVTERLERIEALQRGRASEGALLAELRGLLEDGEAFLAAGAQAPSPCPKALTDRGGGEREVGPRA
jgi:hypothetical protein